MKVLDADAEDLGSCDGCGDTEAKRMKCTRRGWFNDGPALYRCWLCPTCRSAAKKAS